MVGGARQIVEEMERTKAGTNKVPGKENDAGDGDARSKATKDDMNVEGDTRTKKHDNDGDMEIILESAGRDEGKDPVHEKAKLLAAYDINHVSLHRAPETWLTEVDNFVFSNTHSLIYIDCSTSRVSVFFNLLEKINSIKTPWSLFVLCATRVEMLSNVMGALQRKFSNKTVYPICISTGKQTSRVRSMFGVYIPESSAEVVFTHVDISSCMGGATRGVALTVP